MHLVCQEKLILPPFLTAWLACSCPLPADRRPPALAAVRSGQAEHERLLAEADQAGVVAERDLTLVDATCPVIRHAQDKATRLADRGQHVVLIGQPGAAATGPIASRAAGQVTVVETTAGAASMRVGDARRISYMVQPGMPVEAADGIVTALRARFPAAKDTRPAGLCYAASDRAATVRAIAAGSDLVLVLGDPQSPDTRQLGAQARDTGVKVANVQAVSDITPVMLTGVTTIGAVESTSAPAVLAAEVIAALAGLGQLGVGRRQVSTDMAGASGAHA